MLSLAAALAGCDRQGDDPGAQARGAPTNPGAARVEAWLARFRAPHPKPPATEDVGLNAAISLIRQGDHADAVEICDQLLAGNPSFHHARYFRGFANHKQKLYAVARPDFEVVLDAGPVFERAEGVFYYYAWCCYYLGDLDSAEAAFHAVQTLGIDAGDAVYGLGLVKFERGDLDAAGECFRKSLALAGKELAAKGARATNSDRQDVAKAEVRLAGVLLQKAELDLAEGKPQLDEARELLERAVVTISKNEEAWSTLERVYRRLGEKDRAEAARHEIETIRKRTEAAPAGAR